jgi:hypothetical protein
MRCIFYILGVSVVCKLFNNSISSVTRWRNLFRHCATSRKVACSIPNGVIEIFHWHNPSGRTMVLRVDSASNRNDYQECLLVGKGGRCVGLTTLPPSRADCLEIWEPEPAATLRACPCLYRDSFSFYIKCRIQVALNLTLHNFHWKYVDRNWAIQIFRALSRFI